MVEDEELGGGDEGAMSFLMLKVTIGIACCWFLLNVMINVWVGSLNSGDKARIVYGIVDFSKHKFMFVVGFAYTVVRILTALSAFITCILWIAESI